MVSWWANQRESILCSALSHVSDGFYVTSDRKQCGITALCTNNGVTKIEDTSTCGASLLH
jgi:hypothetical protein